MSRNATRILYVLAIALLGGGDGCSCQGGKAAADLNLSYTPMSIDFGTVAIQTSSTITVTLKHVGTSGTIEIGDVYVDSGDADFSLEGPDSKALLPEAQTTIKVTYAPTTSTDANTYLVIKHNVPPLSETRIPITANGQLADLIAIPNPIDFEDVLAGDQKDLDVQVRNIGSDSVTVQQVYLKMDGASDFTLQSLVLPDGTALPVELKPGDELGMVLRYRPTGGDEDHSSLIVEGETRGDVQPWAFDVQGRELGPLLVAAPGAIDYQWVPLNELRVQALLIQNQGNADLKIQSLYVAPGGDPNIVVTDAPTGEVTLPAGTDQTYHVQ